MRNSEQIIKFVCLSAFMLLTACQAPRSDPPAVVIDMRPVDCGYKWFQSGRSPGLNQRCDLPRDEALWLSQRPFAIQHAWEIARERCPTVCPPRELDDPTEVEKEPPQGSCRDSTVYYTDRVFFQCGQAN